MKDKKKGFYKLNNEVLKFDVNKEIDKIRFSQYLIQKENLQRLKGGLPKGQFYLAINSVSKDLNVTFAKARGLIKKFIELDIITNEYTPPKGSKKPSIYSYKTVNFFNNDDNNENHNDDNDDKVSKIEGCEVITNNDNSYEDNNEINNTKKELLKRNIKKNNYTSESNEYRLAVYLFNYIKNNNPNAKEPNYQNWARQFDFILRIDKRDIEEVKELIQFTHKHEFWYKNILSPTKLRDKYDRLILEMREKNGNKNTLLKTCSYTPAMADILKAQSNSTSYENYIE